MILFYKVVSLANSLGNDQLAHSPRSHFGVWVSWGTLGQALPFTICHASGQTVHAVNNSIKT